MKFDRHQAETGAPRIQSGAGSWIYADQAVHAAAIRLHLEHGINLAAIDDWIEAETWRDEDKLQRVLAWRARLLTAADDAAEGWGLFLMTLAALNVREKTLHRLATIGKTWEHRLPAPGERKTVRAPKATAAAKKARNERIRQLAADGKGAAEIASAERLTERQVRRILNPVSN